MLLALDTSTLTLSLSLVLRGPGGRVVEAIAEGPPRKQSEMLPGVIGELLARHGVKLGELEGIAVGLGPGSFTGLRIGLATAKALAYSARVRLAGVSSLAAVALQGPEESELLASTVARQGELYVGRYRRRGRHVELLEPEDAVTPARLAELLASRPGAIALGPSIGEYRAQLMQLGAPPDRLLDEPRFPSAAAIAELAPMSETYDPRAVFALEPHYVRASEAERNPKFPPLPGPAPLARIRSEDE